MVEAKVKSTESFVINEVCRTKKINRIFRQGADIWIFIGSKEGLTMEKNDRVFLSIFIPVYNGAEHLYSLLDSLKKQTCQNFEVVFVDDCSTDNSFEIIQNFIKKLPDNSAFYKLYKTEHNLGAGHFHLRYVLNYLKGKYFFAFSHDDYLDSNFVELCYKKSQESDYDIILTNLCFLTNDETTYLGRDYLLDFANKKLSNRDLFELSLTWKISIAGCRKLQLLKEAGFFNDTYYNIDEFVCRKLLLMTEKIAFVDTNYYYRIDNANALTKKLKPFTFDILTTFGMLIDVMKEYDFSKKKIQKQISNFIDQYKHSCFDFYINSKQFSEDEQKHILAILKNANRKIKSLFPYFNSILYVKYVRIMIKIGFKRKFIYRYKTPN